MLIPACAPEGDGDEEKASTIMADDMAGLGPVLYVRELGEDDMEETVLPFFLRCWYGDGLAMVQASQVSLGGMVWWLGRWPDAHASVHPS